MRVIPADQWAKSSHEAERAHRRFENGLELATRVSPVLWAALMAVRDMQGGQPGAADYGSPMVSSTPGKRDPLTYDGDGNLHDDYARRAEKELLRHMIALSVAADGLATWVSRFTPKEATAQQRRDAEAANRLCCENCSQIADQVTGNPWHSDLEPGRTNPTTVGGRLPRIEALRLCRWCYDRVKLAATVEGTPRLPTEAELKMWHHQGKAPRLRGVA